MKLLHEIALFFGRKLRETIRQFIWLLSGLATPLLYMALFMPLLKNTTTPPLSTARLLDSFVPAILTLLAFNSGMGAGWTLIWELQSGVIERLSVSPASRFALLAGGVLRDICAFLVPAIAVLALAACLGMRLHPAGLAVCLLLLSLLTAITSAWSASLGLLLGEVGSLAAVVNSLQLPLTLLSGVLLPLTLGPPWLRALAHANPLYYTVAASRTLAAGTIVARTNATAFAVIVLLTLLTLGWATTVYKKAVA